jgi:hypothetical protein
MATTTKRLRTKVEGEQEEFDRLADAVFEALEGAEMFDEMAVLTMFLGRWVCGFDPEHRELARQDMQELLDSAIREWVIADADA